jgi:uncharacterized protein YyaL (SSP411 family)
MRLRVLHGASIVIFALTIISCNSGRDENKIPGNRLAEASSPYLREHADNPVNWFEWGTEAIEKAAKENKPIIISVGYASCHWCHVMEEETFMDTAVARIMNENFVSIKIDREERPDIDQIYINAAQLISGHAGWPLNAFTLPDGKPFYAGTYFPKDQWKNLLDEIVKAYKDDFENVSLQANEVAQGVVTSDIIIKSKSSNSKLKNTSEIFSLWGKSIDYELGGLKGAPKFPMPVIWEFLLQESQYSKNTDALKAVTTTLDAMANGGIYDHLAGGFARYSTDDQWKVPHFEKMLYDNGQLVSLYSHAYQVTQKEEYARIVRETIEFINTELTSPDGGFYSSLNADSEGEEGTFYVWTEDEFKNIVGNKIADVVSDYFNITQDGNWEEKKNVLHKKKSVKEIAAIHKLSVDEALITIDEARKKLLDARNLRIHPSLDNKILTSWNALMLTGCIDAYWALGDEKYLELAIRNAAFLKKNLMSENGRLFRSYSNKKASINGFLDDYAFLANAFIQLYQATFDFQWLNDSRKLADYALLHFQDSSSGFFYYTSDESQKLIARKMEIPDQVIPSSNAMMTEVLFKLGTYFSNDSYLKTSWAMLGNLPSDSFQNGPYYAKWASVMGLAGREPYEIAIVGADTKSKSKDLMKNFLPDVLLLGGNTENLPLLENKLVSGKTIIYVCRNKVCKLPVQEVEQALLQLK